MALLKWPVVCLCALGISMPAVAAPARDARGFVVVSNPAVPPPIVNEAARQEAPKGTKGGGKDTVTVGGLNPPPTTGGGMGPAVPTGNGQPKPQGRAAVDSPPCTQKVTDNCLQSYERGLTASRALRRPN